MTYTAVFLKVQEESAESGKPGFVLHKQIIWHDTFRELLKTILLHSRNGTYHHCADDILRWLFPLILILSADYEEQ